MGISKSERVRRLELAKKVVKNGGKTKEVARAIGVPYSSGGRWKKLAAAELRKEKNAADPGTRAAEVMVDVLTERSKRQPTVNTLRTRGAIVLVFDVNATITDVVNTAMNAWHAARA